MTTNTLYKVIFHNQDKIYEVYARRVGQGSLFGFVEIEQLVFGERNSVVVDPSEENLKSEFAGVNRTSIPMHAVIRIDEVKKQGTAKITEGGRTGNITPFPVYTKNNDSGTKK